MVLWGARRGDMQFGSPADVARAERLRRQAALTRSSREIDRAMRELGAQLAAGTERASRALREIGRALRESTGAAA